MSDNSDTKIHIFSEAFAGHLQESLNEALQTGPISPKNLTSLLGLDENEDLDLVRSAMRMLAPEVEIVKGPGGGYARNDTPRPGRRSRTPREFSSEFVDSVMTALGEMGASERGVAAVRLASHLGLDPISGPADLKAAYKAGALPGVRCITGAKGGFTTKPAVTSADDEGDDVSGVNGYAAAAEAAEEE